MRLFCNKRAVKETKNFCGRLLPKGVIEQVIAAVCFAILVGKPELARRKKAREIRNARN